MVAGFKAAFPEFEASRQSIIGRRYGLLHRSSDDPARTVTALEVRIESMRTKLEQLITELEAAREAVAPVDWTEATMDELRAAVKAAGVVPKSRKKRDYIAVLEQTA